jgi:transcriptional regulator with XRE-family HTH domain
MTGTIARPRSRFGEYARARREELGLSVLELAEAVGISPSHLGRIERNLVSPSYMVVTTICRSLNLDILELNQKVRYSRHVDDQLIGVLGTLDVPCKVSQEFLSLSLEAREAFLKYLKGDR